MKYYTKEFVKNFKNPAYRDEIVKAVKEASLQRLYMSMYDFPTLKYNLQNIKIKSIKKIAKNYIIEFDILDDSIIKSITFKNAKIIKQDEDLEGSIWIFDELYKEKNKFEVHILLNKNIKYLDLIIECDDAVETCTELGKIEELLPKNENDVRNLKRLLEIDDDYFKKIALDLIEYLQKGNNKLTKEVIKVLVKRQDLIIDKIKLVLEKSKDKNWKNNINILLVPKLKKENKEKLTK